MNNPRAPHHHRDGDTYQVACTGMIPAERCALLMWGSMSERNEAISHVDTVVPVPVHIMHGLEAHGVDEIDCKWEGLLPMTEQLLLNTGGKTQLVGDCPRCGNEITLPND